MVILHAVYGICGWSPDKVGCGLAVSDKQQICTWINEALNITVCSNNN